MTKTGRSRSRGRAPLSRERVLRKALALADARGIEAVTMRAVAQKLGVEAMSLYKHVANKGDLLDGLVELVLAEVEPPSRELPWALAMRHKARSTRQAMLRHPYAAALVESTLNPGPNRLRLHDATIGVLRAAGFSIELAYDAFLTLDSYVYGFVLQEVNWPFEPGEDMEVVEALRPSIPVDAYPSLVEMMGYVATREAARATTREEAHGPEFERGLDLVLEGLERARAKLG